ncbi:hypothetical protein AKJ37_06885 [candidate division MSBL1 archaeon SCGC-AAA259I09]|uniref:Uncharacterized protein n=5 Tax=candidate division MSBL1 TaxID=215777 RepID=A0A133UMI3_9EURY|nr:hypothetical protein AKJ62_00695 [candidate division MSBL1 archaeon SCGC-AAA259D14]KXA92698.1 hypothetical protein AKJ66_03710 [candidate division MSBL1 archaeon SCGC-AAA259E22]KXA95192.1 hypothetical protein AKJ36_01330 [candidate division MSBL1 archaeon SCGC-AAA259I07]KXA95349.1 hypothetical protein AKJ37_06885 [candidate division MSBL1 archaeon SCGC-AAA259I09]KXA97578.1 hypothetical protein AKJ39_03185 [candidate division MSBL1 archaeon SCGC-AAA259J03]
MCPRESNQERQSLKISLPKPLIERLKEDRDDVEKYIESLIEKDYNKSSSFESELDLKGESEEDRRLARAMKKEAERQDKIKEAMFQFLKKYRDEEWIEYILDTRGEKTLEEEARKLVQKNPDEWSEFVDKFSKSS